MEVFRNGGVFSLKFFKQSESDDVKVNVDDKDVLVFQALDAEKKEEEAAKGTEEVLEACSKEEDKVSEFLALTKKEKLTKEEKRRYRKLVRYIESETSCLKETIQGWVGVVLIVGILGYYSTLPVKIYQHYNEADVDTHELLAMEELVNEEYEAMKEETTYVPFAKVSIETLNVRTEPNEAATRLGQLSKNEEVEILDELEGQDFFKIDFDGQVGYIHKDFVEKINKSIEQAK